MIAIADTGFIVALAVAKERYHARCVAVYKQCTLIYVPQTVLAETCYLITRQSDNRTTANFLRLLPESKYRLAALNEEDILRSASILDEYADTRVDFVDATVIAAAERLDISRILTLDQRDFQIVRPKHTAYFELLPAP